jgi:hypothetical protein
MERHLCVVWSFVNKVVVVVVAFVVLVVVECTWNIEPDNRHQSGHFPKRDGLQAFPKKGWPSTRIDQNTLNDDVAFIAYRHFPKRDGLQLGLTRTLWEAVQYDVVLPKRETCFKLVFV